MSRFDVSGALRDAAPRSYWLDRPGRPEPLLPLVGTESADTCTRFCAFFGTAYEGRLAYAAGYTGLGVGASRFGARVMLDLLAGAPTELTSLELVRSKPLPFPPEPARSLGINLTRWSLARADAHEGRRNLWLRALDRCGVGFDS